MTLQRFPEGITGEEFWTKNPPKGMPDFINPVMCTYPSGRKHLQVVVDEPAAVVWAMQMNTVTFHPWPVRTSNVDNPDELRIDLDPQPGRDFKDSVEAALVLRELLTELGPHRLGQDLRQPRRARLRADRARPTSSSTCATASSGSRVSSSAACPTSSRPSWWKEERGERVFVDFNQACRDRTIASAYSPRPLPGAPVSMPVGWDALPGVSPGDFTVRTVPGIVAADGDAWAGMDDAVGDVTAAIALWDKDVEERGLGELNFPPDYPKMPGEPPRVQPSKRRKDKSDDDYMPPKAERDADLRTVWGPVVPPVAPMLAKPVKGIPTGDYLFEPKWDGFRSIIFRSGDQVEIGSRNEKPMTRYFPEVVEAVLANFPEKCVVDGEIVLIGATGDRLDFEALQQRIHPAASRVKKLAGETPASFVAFDLLALGDDDLTERPFAERRACLEKAFAKVQPPIHLTRATDDPAVAQEWFEQFEGAGLDGVIAKPLDITYVPDKRADAQDQARAHRRLRRGRLPHPQERRRRDRLAAARAARRGRVAAERRRDRRRSRWPGARSCSRSCSPWSRTSTHHPWAWAAQEMGSRTPTSGATSRWNAGKDLSFTPLRPERVVEVKYDHMEGDPVPAHRAVRALARRPHPGVLHLRPARGAGQLRPRRRPR